MQNNRGHIIKNHKYFLFQYKKGYSCNSFEGRSEETNLIIIFVKKFNSIRNAEEYMNDFEDTNYLLMKNLPIEWDRQAGVL